MKKLLLLLLMIGVGLASFATEYDIWVAGMRVTSANANRISGGKITSGYAEYDATNKILRLHDIVINNTATSGQDYEKVGICAYETGLTIYYYGTNTITAAAEAGLWVRSNCTLEPYYSSATISFTSKSASGATAVGCFITDGKTLTINPYSQNTPENMQKGQVTFVGNYAGLWGKSDKGNCILNGGHLILRNYNSRTDNFKPVNGVALTFNNGVKVLSPMLYYSNKYLKQSTTGGNTNEDAEFQSTCGVCVKGVWMPYYNDAETHDITGGGTGTMTITGNSVVMNSYSVSNTSVRSFDNDSKYYSLVFLPNITTVRVLGTNNVTGSNGILAAGQNATSTLLIDGYYGGFNTQIVNMAGLLSRGREIKFRDVKVNSTKNIECEGITKPLTITNSVVNITGGSGSFSWLTGWASLTLSDVAVQLPVGAAYNIANHAMLNGNSYCNQQIVIAPTIGLTICNTPVTYVNCNSITGTGISGTVKYDPANSLLTLSSATLTNSGSGEDVIQNTGVSDLTIGLSGINTITAGDDAYTSNVANGVTTFTGTGTLNAKGYIYANASGQTFTFSGGCTVNQHTSGAITSAQKFKLNVNNATVKATGIRALSTAPTLTSVLITSPAGAAYNPNTSSIELDGAGASSIVIEPATGYSLWVGGVQVHSKNASAIKGSHITGTVSYNSSTKTLTLNGATITSGSGADDNASGYGIHSRISDLLIKLVGTNKVTGSTAQGIKSEATTTISGPSTSTLDVRGLTSDGIYISTGSLTVQDGATVIAQAGGSGNYAGIYGTNSYKLNVKNSVVKATATAGKGSIYGFASIEQTGTMLSTPVGATYNTANHQVELNGSPVKSQVIIEPFYDLKIGGVQVTQSNASKITGSTISGTVSYTPSTNILTLNGATISVTSGDGILTGTGVAGMKIQLTGTNYIKYTGGSNSNDGIDFSGSTTITGTGTLNINGFGYGIYASYSDSKTLTISGGCIVDINSPDNGLSCANAAVKIENSELRALGSSYSVKANTLTMTGVDIAQPAGAVFKNGFVVDANGSTVKTQVIIKKVTKYTITAVANNSTWGSVSGGGSYAENSYVDLVATANAGYHFVKWADDNSTSPTRTVKVTANKTYTANFEANAPDQYTITVKSANPAWGDVTGTGTYAANSTQTIKATPKTGYEFVKWDDGDKNATRQIKVTANKTYTATFQAKKFKLTVQANDSDMGNALGSGTYDYNTDAECEAIAKTGYEFVEWSDGNKNAKRTYTVTKDDYLTAMFQPIKYLITVDVNDATMGSAIGGGYYDYNSYANLSVETNYGYRFVKWDDGVEQAARQIKVTKEEKYTAIFEIRQFAVTVASNNEAWGTVDGAGDYDYNTTATITALPNKGYKFVKWNDNDSSAIRYITVTEDVNLTAVFESETGDMVMITALPNDETMGTVTGGGEYAVGTDVTLKAIPNPGYKFVQWNDEEMSPIRTFVAQESAVYTAIFEPTSNDTVTIKVISNDETMGAVTGGGEFPAGTEVTIKAVAFPGYKFVKWDDDNEEAVRTFVATESLVLTAIFADDNAIEDNEMNNFIVFARHADIVVRNAERNQIAIFDVNGKLIYLQQGNGADENVFTMPSAGVYFVKIGATTAKKVVVLK